MLSRNGRFLAAVQGFTPGNVLLRREQYRRADDPDASLQIARPIVAAKIANLRTVLLRAARDHPPQSPNAPLPQDAAQRMAHDADAAMNAANLDQLRGIEGESSATYFRSFDTLITTNQKTFRFEKRSRRPPMNPCNALLSFLYTLLALDYRSACESVGLDAQSGFLHRNRPGRPSLALDLMEALRPVMADRLALSLINRQQVKPNGFTTTESGAVTMNDATRKTVLVAWQKRKQDELVHPFINEKLALGLIPPHPGSPARTIPPRRPRPLPRVHLAIKTHRKTIKRTLPMLVLITYDVATSDQGGTKRLRQTAKACLDYGQRVQCSVFECQVDPAQWATLKHRLESIINPATDSLRYYYLGKHGQRRVEHVGAKPATDLEGPLII